MIQQCISYVSQQPVLFSGSIEENIRLARPNATFEEVLEAARMASVHDEIMAMPDQYTTIVGERGIRLSGGQKQRLAIARALLADRPILIIDDALSALDTESEQQVFAGIRSRQQGKILLIVSHRLKVLSAADQIVIMDQGRIIDEGNHDHLLKSNSLYQSMAAKQLRKKDA